MTWKYWDEKTNGWSYLEQGTNSDWTSVSPNKSLESRPSTNQNSKKEFIDSYNSRILKKSSIDKYHTGIISSDVRIPPQRRNSPISRPETAARNLDFLPKLSFQNFETNLPKPSFILDGGKLRYRDVESEINFFDFQPSKVKTL